MVDRIEGEGLKEVNDAQVWTSFHQSGRAGFEQMRVSQPKAWEGWSGSPLALSTLVPSPSLFE